MCQGCVDAVRKHYPLLSEEDQGRLLWSATAFPMGNAEVVERQLAELKEKTDGTLQAAINFAVDELDRGMAQFHANEEYDSWTFA